MSFHSLMIAGFGSFLVRRICCRRLVREPHAFFVKLNSDLCDRVVASVCSDRP